MYKVSNYAKVRKLLSELGISIQRPLFHSTSLSKFQRISESGLKAKAGGPYNDAYHDNAVCFSRNLDFLYANIDYFGSAQVIIVVDGSELANKLKLYPFDYYPGSKARLREKQSVEDYEFEERVSVSPPVRGKEIEEDVFCLRETIVPPSYFKCLIVRESFWDRNIPFFLNLGIPVIIEESKTFRIPQPGYDFDKHENYDADIDWHEERIQKLFKLKKLNPQQLEVAKKFYHKKPEKAFSLISKTPVNSELADYICQEYLIEKTELEDYEIAGLEYIVAVGNLSSDTLESIFYKIALPQVEEDINLLTAILEQKSSPPNLLFVLEENTSISTDSLIEIVESSLSTTSDMGVRNRLVNYLIDYAKDVDGPDIVSKCVRAVTDYLNIQTFKKVVDLVSDKKEYLDKSILSEILQEHYIKYIHYCLSDIIDLIVYFRSYLGTKVLEKIFEKFNVKRSDLLKMSRYADEMYPSSELNVVIKNRLQKNKANPLN